MKRFNDIGMCFLSVLVLAMMYILLNWHQSQDKAIVDHNRLKHTGISRFHSVSLATRYTFNPLHGSGSERGTTIAERSFNIPDKILSSIGFPLDLSGVTSLTASGFDQFVFVTASSANHFHEAMDAVAGVQQHFPNHKLYYYDLETSTSQGTVNKLEALCNVVYRKFNYDGLPPHVREHTTYAFKPLVIHEVLLEHKTLFWIDASIRFKENLDSIRNQTINESRGVLMFDYTGHSIFAATHETMFKYIPMSMSAAIDVSMMCACAIYIHCSQQTNNESRGVLMFIDAEHSILATAHTTMFKYLPMNISAAIKVSEGGSGAIYIHCSQQLYDAVIRWWVLCALEPSCISPIRKLGCDFNGNSRDRYAGCHRFDQSTLNTLLANYFDNDFAKYSSRHSVLSVERGSSNVKQLRVCNAHGSVISSLNSGSYFNPSTFA